MSRCHSLVDQSNGTEIKAVSLLTFSFIFLLIICSFRSFRLFRSFRFGRFGGFVSAFSFHCTVSGFSTCRDFVVFPSSKISSTTKQKLYSKSLDISKQRSTVF